MEWGVSGSWVLFMKRYADAESINESAEVGWQMCDTKNVWNTTPPSANVKKHGIEDKIMAEKFFKD